MMRSGHKGIIILGQKMSKTGMLLMQLLKRILKTINNIIMEKQELIIFHDTIKTSGSEVFVKPICDYFGIEYDNQLKVINNDPILKTSVGKNQSMLLFGDKRERVTLSKRGVIRWIQLINPQIVQVSLRDKLIEYQVLIFDFLYGNIEKEEENRNLFNELQGLRSQQKELNARIKEIKDQMQYNMIEKYGIQQQIDFKKD